MAAYSRPVTELLLDVDLSHPRGRVWRALTDPDLLNRWFQPIEEGWVTPTEELPSFGPFELETLVSDPPVRLVWRWRGEDFSSEVEWTLTKDGGDACRLALRQTGFLGTREVSRRDELFNGYRMMLNRRLPTVLARLAEGAPDADRLVPRTETEPEADHSRVRLLSLIGAVVLVVLFASAAGVWINNGGSPTLGDAGSGHGLGTGSQPGSGPVDPGKPSTAASRRPTESPPPSGRPTASPTQGPRLSSPAPGSPGGGATATYRTIALLGLLGFDTEVTVHGDPRIAWTIVLVMPDETAVQNRSPQTVNLAQSGKNVTLTPVSGGGDAVFTVRFPALLALGKSIKECTIDGQPCSGS